MNSNIGNKNNASVRSEGEPLNLISLFKVYIKHFAILSLISVIVAIVVFIGVKKIYNNRAQFWTVQFEYEFPGIESGRYPDGSAFKYYDFINQEMIENALLLDSFLEQSISIDVLRRNNNISIVQNTIESRDNDGNLIIVPDGTYTISIKKTAISNGDTVEKFVQALLNAFTNKIQDQAKKVYYHTYIDSYNNANTFESKISYLLLQKEYLDSIYDEWIEAYGDQCIIDDKALKSYKEEALMALPEMEYSVLNNELIKKQYVYKLTDAAEQECKIQIEILNDEYDDNQKKIDGLVEALRVLREGDSTTRSDITLDKSNETRYYETVAELTERQIDIEREIINLNTKIENINNSSSSVVFNEKLNKISEQLEQQATIAEKNIAKYLYSEKTVYNIISGILLNGGRSAGVSAIIAFVFVYLISGFIWYVMKREY